MGPSEPRDTVARLLRGSQAHAGLEKALEGFPVVEAGRRVEGHRHTAWELLEHLRLTAEDLLSYCEDPDYAPLDWPEDYWPESAAPPSAEAWEESRRQLLAATGAVADLVEDADRDLYRPVPAAEDPSHHTLRAALVLLDHNAYHVGQLVALRVALGAWSPR